jgi:hypothetical protein
MLLSAVAAQRADLGEAASRVPATASASTAAASSHGSSDAVAAGAGSSKSVATGSQAKEILDRIPGKVHALHDHTIIKRACFCRVPSQGCQD